MDSNYSPSSNCTGLQRFECFFVYPSAGMERQSSPSTGFFNGRSNVDYFHDRLFERSLWISGILYRCTYRTYIYIYSFDLTLIFRGSFVEQPTSQSPGKLINSLNNKKLSFNQLNCFFNHPKVATTY